MVGLSDTPHFIWNSLSNENGVVFALPIILICQLRSNSRSERYSIFFLLFLGLASVIATGYFVLDTHVNNYNNGAPLTLAKRNIFILDQVLANLLLLAAIAMPSVRLLFRSKRNKRQRLEGMSPIVRAKISRGDDEIGLEMRRLHGAYGEDILIEDEETGRPFSAPHRGL